MAGKPSDKKPVKNMPSSGSALMQALNRHQVSWHWVKGHAGHDDNERADELAREGHGAVQEEARHLILLVIPAKAGIHKASPCEQCCPHCTNLVGPDFRRGDGEGAGIEAQSCFRIVSAPETLTPGLSSTLTVFTTPSSTIIE